MQHHAVEAFRSSWGVIVEVARSSWGVMAQGSVLSMVLIALAAAVAFCLAYAAFVALARRR